MSRTRRLFAGFGIGLVNQAFFAFVGLFVTRFVLHRVGEHDYGLWVVGGQFVGYLALLDLGVTALLPRDVAAVQGKPIDEGTREREMHRVIARSVALVVMLTPLLVIAGAVVIALIPRSWEALRWPLAISLGAFVVTYPLRVAHATLTGLQELAFLGWSGFGGGLVGVVLTVVLVHYGLGLYGISLGWASGQIVGAISWVVWLFAKHRRYVPRDVPWFERDAMRAQLLPSTWVLMTQISVLLLNSTDALVIGRLRGPEQVTTYALTDKLQTFLNNQPLTLALSAGPALAELHAARDPARTAQAIRALSAVMLAVSGAIVIAILAVNHTFVRVWVGEQHFGGTLLTVLLVANMFVRHWSFPYVQAVFYFGFEKAQAILILVDGVLTVVLMVVFVRWYGIVGAPLAQVTSAVLVQLPASVVVAARAMGSRPAALLAGSGSTRWWFVVFAVLAPAATWIGLKVGQGYEKLPQVAALAAAVGLAYAIAIFPMLRRPPLDTYARPFLKKLGL